MRVVGITAIVRNGKEIVMQLRDNDPGIHCPGMWCLPGGKANEGETAEEAARREIREETGYVPDKMEEVGETWLEDKNGEKAKLVFFRTEYDGTQEINCNEGQEMRWWKWEDLKKAKIIDTQMPILEKIFKK